MYTLDTVPHSPKKAYSSSSVAEKGRPLTKTVEAEGSAAAVGAAAPSSPLAFFPAAAPPLSSRLRFSAALGAGAESSEESESESESESLAAGALAAGALAAGALAAGAAPFLGGGGAS